MRKSLSPVVFEVPAQPGWTRLVDLLTVLALLALAGWWLAAPADIPASIRGAILVVALGATLIGWLSRRAEACQLRWDGRQWFYSPREPAGKALTPGNLRVIVDLQYAMLLRFEPDAGKARVRWFAVDCRTLRPDWHLLRCAAFRQTSAGSRPASVQRLAVPE